MRPIKESLLLNLTKQAEEADLLGLTKIASQITSQVESFPVRSSGLFSYASQELEAEIDSRLWTSAIDTLNFHNVSNFDVREIENFIISSRNEFLDQLRHKIGCLSPHGAFEDSIPGEKKEIVDLEINEI